MTSAESRKLVHEFSPEYNAHELFHLDFTKELGRVVDLSKRRDPFDSREALDRASKYIEAHTFVPTLCHVWLYIREAELAQKNGDDALSIQFFRRAAKLDSEGIACQAWSADAGSNGEQLYGPYAELAKKHKLSELPMIQAKLDSFRKNQNHGCLALP